MSHILHLHLYSVRFSLCPIFPHTFLPHHTTHIRLTYPFSSTIRKRYCISFASKPHRAFMDHLPVNRQTTNDDDYDDGDDDHRWWCWWFAAHTHVIPYGIGWARSPDSKRTHTQTYTEREEPIWYLRQVWYHPRVFGFFNESHQPQKPRSRIQWTHIAFNRLWRKTTTDHSQIFREAICDS